MSGSDANLDSTRPDRRPIWAMGLSLFCVATFLFLVSRDLFVPAVRDTEVWFGFELRGTLARVTAPLHWAIFAVAAWGYWHCRSWIWPWASVYAFYIAVSHFIWNVVSPSGGGLADGSLQFVLFAIPAFALLRAKPSASRPATPDA